MDPINTSRWQNKIRAMFGLKGGNPIPTLADLVPVVPIEVERPEWSLAGGETLWSGLIEQPAVAAEFGFCALVNLAASGVLCIVEEVGPSVAAFLIRLQTTAIPGFVAGQQDPGYAREFRLALTRISAARLDRGTNAVALGPPTRLAMARRIGATGVSYNQPIIVSPGQALVVEHTAVNVAFAVTFVWREVLLESGTLG